jgi:uncharacterized protein YutE (UPF0331/DUF86 family)
MTASDKLKAKLQADVETLQKLETYVRESAEICRVLDFDTLNAQGYREIEALTARFERAQDFFVTKVLRTIDMLEGEEGVTIDVLNRSEKRGIIKSAEVFLEMRRLRNKIAHEYSGYGPTDIARTVLDFVPTLLHAYEQTREYASRPEFRPEFRPE